MSLQRGGFRLASDQERILYVCGLRLIAEDLIFHFVRVLGFYCNFIYSLNPGIEFVLS
jgi:hypothetical protein